MLYHNPEFFFLLLPTILLYRCFESQRARFAVLVISSLLFYAWTGASDSLIFLIVIVFSWSSAWAGTRLPAHRKLFVTIGIAAMLAHLIFWKYTPWLIQEWQSVQPTFLHGERVRLPLPIGISFFTLQGIAYLVDFQRGQVRLMRFREFVLFKSFFPQLVAGPIVRAPQLLPQLRRLPTPTPDDLLSGVSLLALGFFKKLLVADRLPPLIDGVFAHPSRWNRASLLWAALGYTVQIWADFSGYTDMGRGAARLFGIRLPENFLSPYLSKKPSEFWRRWHVTLSEWIRDYLYIPLGGNRGPRARVAVVLLTTMTISGLWHGANWTFVCWGILHGLLLIAERLAPWCFGWVTTQAAVIFGWVLFRCETFTTFRQYLHMLQVGDGGSAISPGNIILNGSICLALHFLFYSELRAGARHRLEIWRESLYRWIGEKQDRAIALGLAWGATLAAACWGSLIFRSGAAEYAFLYFKF